MLKTNVIDPGGPVTEKPTIPTTDLGEASHIEVVDRLLQVDNAFVVDVGKR